MEIWVPVKGYEGLYEVSNLGNLRSLDYMHTKLKKIMKPREIKGYLIAHLCKDGKTQNIAVHRLVAEAFLPNWFDEPQVNHKDENKKNNNVDNLEWCSAKYNSNYGTRNSRLTKRISKPVLQFTKTGEFVKEWPSTMEAGRNGYCQSSVADCCRGEMKHHKGYIWKYKE